MQFAYALIICVMTVRSDLIWLNRMGNNRLHHTLSRHEPFTKQLGQNGHPSFEYQIGNFMAEAINNKSINGLKWTPILQGLIDTMPGHTSSEENSRLKAFLNG